jgi:hypothetical protein
MSARERKRSTRYVNSLLQGHMMWRMATYWMIYNAALIGVIAGEKLMRFIPDMIAGRSAFSFGEFISQFASESRVLIVAMLVFCPLLIWDMLKFSHRMGDFQGTFSEFLAYVHSHNPDSARGTNEGGSADRENQHQTAPAV